MTSDKKSGASRPEAAVRKTSQTNKNFEVTSASSESNGIEFERWDTPFSFGDLHIFDLQCDCGPFQITFADPPRRYRLNDDQSDDSPRLQAKIFDSKSEQLFLLSFETLSGARYLDEHGLTELWSSPNYKPKVLGSCFRVRNHMWHRESPITFLCGMKGEWSYLVATIDDCLEIVSSSVPVISSLGKVTPHNM